MSRNRRDDVYAVYAFCRYTDNIIDAPRTRDNDALQGELDAWREELCRANGTGESQHPVLSGFVRVMRAYGIPLQLPLELIRGVEMDLRHDRYESFTDLNTFCYRVASVVGVMMTHVFGFSDESAFHYAETLGLAMQLTNILRDVDEDWRLRRKIYLPLEEMRRFGLEETDIAERKMSEDMRAFLTEQVRRAHAYFENADVGISMLHRRSRMAVAAASALYREILREIERSEYDVFSRRPVVPTHRKIRILLGMTLSRFHLGKRGNIHPAQPRSTAGAASNHSSLTQLD